MHLKDYYKILELEPSASLPDIKKAYRKLAQQHHPDKSNDPYSAAFFTEIKEAYEVLSNSSKKNNYLQQRWYHRAKGKDAAQAFVTPIQVLQQALEFEKYTATLDEFRMDKDNIYLYMNELLDEATIHKLQLFNEVAINDSIVCTLLKPMRFLNSQQASLLVDKFVRLSYANTTQLSLQKKLHQIKQQERWQKMQWWLMLLTTLLICWLIWFAAQG